MARKKQPSDPLADLLGPAMARQIAEAERLQHMLERARALDTPLADTVGDTTREMARAASDDVALIARDHHSQFRDAIEMARNSGLTDSDRIARAMREAERLAGPAGLHQRLASSVQEQLGAQITDLELAARPALADAFDSLLDSNLLPGLGDELARLRSRFDVDQLFSAQLGDYLAQAHFDAADLIDELFEQPGWRSLIDPLREHADSNQPHPDAPPPQAKKPSFRQLVRETGQVLNRNFIHPPESGRTGVRWRRVGLAVWFALEILSTLHWTYSRVTGFIGQDDAVPAQSTPAPRDAAVRRDLPAPASANGYSDGKLSEPTRPPAPETRAEDECPATVAEAGPDAIEAWQTFFAARIANPGTRAAYLHACVTFFDWCRHQGLALQAIQAVHVATWRDSLLQEKSAATVKQKLSALRCLYDWLVIRQVVPANPAHAVRTPRLSRDQSETRSLDTGQIVALFDRFDPDHLVDLRDRALLGVMTFALARVSAAARLTVGDLELSGSTPGIWLHEKRGNELRVPLDDVLTGWLADYLRAAGIAGRQDSPLFRSFGRGRGGNQVTERPLSRQDIHAIVRRRLHKAGLRTVRACHSLRASGITLLLRKNVPIELVARLAGHASIVTTQKYDDRSLDEMREALERLR